MGSAIEFSLDGLSWIIAEEEESCGSASYFWCREIRGITVDLEYHWALAVPDFSIRMGCEVI